MAHSTIPFPWYLLIHADDETPLIVSAADFDMVVIFTDLEFARLFGRRSGSQCDVLQVIDPQQMILFFEALIEAATTVDDRPINHACFDPIDPAGHDDVFAFEVKALLKGLRESIDQFAP